MSRRSAHGRTVHRRTVLGGLGALALSNLAVNALGRGLAHAAPTVGRLALVGGTLMRSDAEPLKDAVIVIEDGKIAYIGKQSLGDDRSRVGQAEELSIAGKLVTAGFVDLLTSVGIVEVSLEESTRDDSFTAHDSSGADDPVRAAFMTADGYNPASSLVPITRLGGITSLGVVPHGGLISGQSAWVDLDGDNAEDAITRRSLALHVHIDDPSHGGTARSRGWALLRLRELFDDARSYQRNKNGYERRQLRELGASRLDLEVVLRALAGTLPVVAHVDRASDILAILRLARDNGLRLVLASAAEGWKVAEAIAEAKVPAVIYGLDDGPRSFSALGAREDNAALLDSAGVSVSLSTGQSHNARKLRQVAGNAVRAGLPPGAALAAVTEAPARALGMGEEYGTPQVGRAANLAVWSADPFELSTRLEALLIHGRKVSLRSRQTALYERYR